MTTPDIEVARYALRTFRVQSKPWEHYDEVVCWDNSSTTTILRSSVVPCEAGLYSLYHPIRWTDGTLVAQCRAHINYKIFFRGSADPCVEVFMGPGCPNPPEETCTCGVYGAVSMESLWSQYSLFAETNVAVIAAEGQTMVGDRGLRTTAARVVAFAATEKSTFFAQQCPEATHYPQLNDMLTAYGFEPWGRHWGRPLVSRSILHRIRKVLID